MASWPAMTYRLAPAEQVTTAVEKVLAQHGVVASQTSFIQLVRRELDLDWSRFRLGTGRLRKLAVRSGLTHLEVQTRANPKPRVLHRCPVCGADFDPVRNSTIYGGKVTLGHRCSLCHFSTGKDWREPARYIFHYLGPCDRRQPAVEDQSLLTRREAGPP